MNAKSDYQGPQYPTTAHGAIPAFSSYEEEAAFWDTHDFTDFRDQTTPVRVRSTRGLNANVQVRFDTESDRELETFASERGLKKATLIRTWVLERLRQERERRVSS
ncbi:MAG: CopG family antitoxin [Ktedonobacterales bacterium]